MAAPGINDDSTFRQRLAESRRLGGLAVRLAWRASPRLTLGILALDGIQALLPPLQLALAAAVVDRAALDLGLADASADGLVAELPLVAWAVLAALVLATSQIIQPLARTWEALAGDRLVGHVSEQLMVAANAWPGLARFEDPAFADDLHQAQRYAVRGGLDLVLYGAGALLHLATAGALALTLVGLHPLVPVLVVAASLPFVTSHWVYTHRTGSHLYGQTPETRRLLYSRNVTLSPEPAQDVRLYELGGFFQRHYDEIFERTTAELQALRRRLAGRVVLAGALAAVTAGGVYVWLVTRIAAGGATVGDLVLYGGAVALLQSNLAQLGFSIGYLPFPLAALPALFRVLDAPPDLPLPRAGKRAPRPLREGIVFDDVTFTYPGRDEPALAGVSCHLRPEECVALVGRNGAGKTTLVKLLLRLYDPDAGRVLLDGVDLRDHDLVDLRRQVGVIFQDFVRYELSAAHNIGLGCPDTIERPDRLLAAATRAGADELVAGLPNGLATQLGRQFAGRELSEGEWQKLALARALVGDSQLLVLDEPTAALDVQTEHDLYRRFAELTANRTTVLVSHRLSTVRMADRILFFDGGRIAEEGSHDELVVAGGGYAHLYRLQAAHYLDGAGDAASTDDA